MSLALRSPRLRVAFVGAVALVVGQLSITPATAEDLDAGDRPVTVVGEMVRVWADPDTDEEHEHADSQEVPSEPQSWIEPESGEAVRVPTEQVAEVATGATVEVRVGEELVDKAAEAGAAPAREVLSAEVVAPPAEAVTAPASDSLTNEVTVVLVRPPGSTSDGTTSAEVVAAVDGQVADFWERESNGAVRIGVAAHEDWLDVTTGCDQPILLWDEVATAVGFASGPGQHLMLYLPGQPGTLPDCSDGLGQVGTAPGDGGRSYVRGTETSLIAHELGHNFGLGHSGSLTCDAGIEAGNCALDEYGDFYDVMGYSWQQVGSLSTPHAAQLGFLPASQTFTFSNTTRGGYVTLSPLSGRSGMRAVRLVDSLGVEYWIEYRDASGPDAWLANPSTTPHWNEPGVLIRNGELLPGVSLLLDASPSSPGYFPPGQVLNSWRSVRVAGGEFLLSVSEGSGGRPMLRVTTQSGDAFPRDFSGENRADLVTVDRSGNLLLYPGSGTGGFWARRTIGRGWQHRDLIAQVGDWNGDGRRDVIARDPRNGDLWLYRGNGAGGFAGWGVIGRGWSVMEALFSPGDWDGDGNADLLARPRSGTYGGHLMLYRGNGRGGFLGAGESLGSGWGAMRHLAAAGDWDDNGTQDFVAVDRWTGVLYLYRGNGTGGFSGYGRVVLGRGWLAFDLVVGPGDWNGDGRDDLIVRQGNGALWAYASNPNGSLQSPRRIGNGWQVLRVGA